MRRQRQTGATRAAGGLDFGHDLAREGVPDSIRVMRLLVLGGTSFVGRAIVEDALTRGVEVTLFNRGKTGLDVFPDLPLRVGDRDAGDYATLHDGEWDAVVDVNGYIPRHVAQAADALEGRVGRYLFISTGSVYDTKQLTANAGEDASRVPAIRDTEEVTGESYGGLKVACEDDVLTRFGDGGTIVRPGVVAGPFDPTDRFTWWVRRATVGGRLGLAGQPDQPVQVVDHADLARLVVALVQANQAGVYNGVGPAQPTTMADLIRACAEAAGTEVQVIPVSPGELAQPLLLPDPSWYPLFQLSPASSHAAGMTHTPLNQTASKVLAWDRRRGHPDLTIPMDLSKEAELLAG